MHHDLVSIITPSYNCGSFIAETIQSIQNQTYKEWELIIVDDCSTDNTEEIVNRFIQQDSRIHYIVNEKNSGAAVSRNRALRESKGRWIAFLDSDDLWLPEKLEKQIKFMKDNGYAFSYHEYDEIDENSHPLGVHVSGIKKVGQLAMYTCCWPGCLTVMYDKDVIGLIQIADIKKENDSAMWLQISKHAPCFLLKENLALYRRRKGSITPPDISTKIMCHYNLFHDAAGMNSIASWFWTICNIICNSYKKMFYVTKYNIQQNI